MTDQQRASERQEARKYLEASPINWWAVRDEEVKFSPDGDEVWLVGNAAFIHGWQAARASSPAPQPGSRRPEGDWVGDRELIEDSWRDDFWGWGPHRNGKNMLGKLWMEIRSELRAALSPSSQEHTK
jgi:hypothetical protein